MHTRSNLHILYTILALMIVQAHCSQLMCYICEDCNEIMQTTPKEVCDETFFNKDTTLPPTTTTVKISTSTTKPTETTVPQPTESTSPTPPKPPTIGPVETTTPLPTPPNPGTVAGPTDLVATLLNNDTTTTEIQSAVETSTFIPSTTLDGNETTLDGSETTFPTTILQPVKLIVEPAEIRMRQKRSVLNAEFTYHCYSVKQDMNGTATTSRGCSRVGPTQGVCNQLEEANNNTKFSNCYPCTSALCNSSSTAGVSMVAIMLSFVAALFLRSSA